MSPIGARMKPALDIFFENPDLAIFAAANSFANDFFNDVAVCFKHSLQFAQVTSSCLKQILNGFVLNEAPTWVSIDQDRKSYTPVDAILNRSGWKFDMHRIGPVVEKVILA